MPYLVFSAYAAVIAASYILKRLNLGHLKTFGHQVPEGFEGRIDPALLGRTSDYVLENSRLESIESLINSGIVILLFFGGLLGGYDALTARISDSFVVRGLVFFLGLMLAGTIIGIPFSLYRNFVIEKRYGFNTMTPGIWLSDLIKGFLISLLLASIAISAGLFLVLKSPGLWWLWVWAFFLFFSVFLMYISPYVIEPLFFRFEPVSREGLEDKIKTVLEPAGLRISRVFQVDASRRSRHSNAYFTGIGRVKRIVLFDTLIEQMSDEEILAVLAHEAGHWKKRHIMKRLVATELVALLIMFVAHRLLHMDGLPGLVGLGDLSFYGRVVLLGFLGSIAVFPLTPLMSFLSRRHEWEADEFAGTLTGKPADLASALVKLTRENLSNLHPHPLYADFYYSHPPVVKRVKKLLKNNN